MYNHILIPTDGSPLSEAAVKQGCARQVRQREGDRDHRLGAIPHAGLLGGLSEAIELNNQALITALERKDLRMKAQAHEQRRKR